MNKKLKSFSYVIVGGGGHAKTIISLTKVLGLKLVGYTAPTESHLSKNLNYLGDDEVLKEKKNYALKHIISFSFFNKKTQKIYQDFFQKNSHILNTHRPLIHPSAIIDADVKIGAGTVVGPGAVIRTGTQIGDYCLINSRALIEHDCIVESHSHIAPGAIICGQVKIEKFVLVGAGAIVLNGSCLKFGSLIKASSLFK
jgi:sugar O-acyltransferase (sialic acid O-acetyltransferase NeuD family)